MNVQQLIEELSKHPMDAMVVVSGYEGGVDEVTTVEQSKIELNVNDEWYYGDHETTSNANGVPAVYIG